MIKLLNSHKQQGFTLVELVLVIILLGIVATFTGRFISSNVSFYQLTVNQNERLNDARFVINRMTKELDSAIAFSVTVDSDGHCMNFVPFSAAGQYAGRVAGDDLVELIVGPSFIASAAAGSFTGRRLSVLTTDADEFYRAVANASDSIATIDSSSVSGAVATVDLDDALVQDSAVSRYFIAADKVRYCLTQADGVMRLSRSQTPLTAIAYPPAVLMAENLGLDSQMRLTGASQFSHAILALDFNFILRDGSELEFQHQVVMTNVP